MSVKTILFTMISLVAFAANSIFCRMALGGELIDGASFTAIRLFSGVVFLFLLVWLREKDTQAGTKGSWFGAWMLFLYASCFSFAYLTLNTGTGALILFGVVQITMIAISIKNREAFHALEWAGLLVAMGGFVYLVLPGVTAPPFLGFSLMSIAGVAWGFYTYRGKNSTHPLLDTACNFLRTMPLVVVLMVLSLSQIEITAKGVLYASLSGALASGMGYAIWYTALKGLLGYQAAVVQLLVPIIAAVGGGVFLSETLSFRIILSAILILSGILFVLFGRFFLNHGRHGKN